MAVGRISGPLLKDNLLRNGVDLAFETSLLYLDVANSRIGINTASPTNDLQINGTTRTTNLEVTNTSNLASFTISNNTISSSSNIINLLPTGSNPVVYQAKISVGTITVGSNTIATTGTDLNISPSGITKVNSDMLVNGNIHATGSITADGNIQLGNQTSDTVSFTAEIKSDIIPNANITYNLGSNSLQWANLYADHLVTNTITTTNVVTNDIKTTNLDISGNTISSIAAGTDINLATSGLNGVIIGNFKFQNNNVTNLVPNATSVFGSTNSGYFKFAGTKGLVIPSGNSSTDRPPTEFAELGMIRFNTDGGYLEIYDSTSWINIAGSGGVSYGTATDIGIRSALMLG